MFKIKYALCLGLLLAGQTMAGTRPNVWVEQIRKWKQQDSFICRVYRDSGMNQGKIFFKKQFPSCAHVYLTSEWFSSYFGNQTEQSPSREQVCYEYGFKLGFMSSYTDLWSGCHDDLNEAVHNENTEAMLQCQTLAAVLKQDRADEGATLAQDPSVPPNMALDLAKLIVLMNRGNYEEPWRKIVELHAEGQRDLVPCTALLSQALAY